MGTVFGEKNDVITASPITRRPVRGVEADVTRTTIRGEAQVYKVFVGTDP
jgi:hypothetical protein